MILAVIREGRIDLMGRLIRKPVGVQVDQIITVTGFYSHRDYPEKLRRIRYFDAETKRRLILLINHISLPALVIA